MDVPIRWKVPAVRLDSGHYVCKILSKDYITLKNMFHVECHRAFVQRK